jgi:hypothetical protein
MMQSLQLAMIEGDEPSIDELQVRRQWNILLVFLF